MNKIRNEFEGKIRITNFTSEEEILDKIKFYCNVNRTEKNDTSLYDIEKESHKMLLLNFHKNTELANYVNRKLKLLQIENSNFSKLNSNLLIKIKNPNNEKKKLENKDNNDDNNENHNKEKNKMKKHKSDIYNIDTNNNPKLNRILCKSLNFNKKNINKCTNPENNKLKIYESIFLGGPFINKIELMHEENRKNKEQWLSKKGFIPFISKNTILKKEHPTNDFLYPEPVKNRFNFRSVEKAKWIGKRDFIPYS